MQEWRVYSKRADFKAIGDSFGIDQVVARIIRNRDVCGDKAIERYLNGSKKDLYDAHSMKDMDKALDILSDCIRQHRKIRIIGDYDIDGICSIYILFMGLKELGADVDYDVPDRVVDGYGINENLIKKAHEANRDVIVTCDNGIAAVEQIGYAKELGMTVIVTDHHDVQYDEIGSKKEYRLPPADAVVDPKQADCSYPFKYMCGAGIAYKVIGLLFERFGIDNARLDEMELIGFAAFATVGDIVDLLDENRIIVKEGLKVLRTTKNLGLNALMSLTDVKKESLNVYHIGFILGPCINASGRLDTAKRALQMLLATDRELAERYAGELKDINDERKNLTVVATQKAIEIVEQSDLSQDRVLVVYVPDCHESICGIVAGRVREYFYRPTIVLTDCEEGIKGSARSIDEYNIFEGLMECADLLERFGGHPMAAGLTLKADNLQALRKRLNENCQLTDGDLIEKIWIDVPMPLEYISYKVVQDIDLLEPYGKSNPKPVFADKNLILRNVSPMGKDGNYTKMRIQKDNGLMIDAVGFFAPDELLAAYEKGKRVSITYFPEVNEFRGDAKLQVRVLGYRTE